jgi:hypothetical protein
MFDEKEGNLKIVGLENVMEITQGSKVQRT